MQLRFFLLFFVCINIFTPARAAEQKLSVSAAAFGQLENFRSLKLPPGGNRMASLRNFKGKTSLVTQSMDPADKGRWYVIDLDKGEFNWFKWLTNDRLAISVWFLDMTSEIISQSADKKKFIIKTLSPTNPGYYYFLDLNTNKIDWFSESYPGLDDEKLSPMKSVTYQARDGLDIPAYLSLPARVKDQKNLPTIIMLHGGPFARDGYGFDYWGQFLTTRGYAALQTLVKEPGLYKCSVAFAPVTNMITMFNNFKKFFGQCERYMPYIRNEAVSLSDISPYKNIDKINVPVLLVHGTDDRRVDYKHGNMFAKAMKRKKKNIRFVTLKEGDHHLSRQKHRIKFLKEMEKFLKKNL